MDKVILVEPEIPENTGFIARLAANFDAGIRIVKPEFNLSEARKTANDCQEKLRNAEIYQTLEKAVEDLDYVVGTKPGKGIKLKEFTPRENTSLVIGRESNGLSNQELKLCDTVFHIQTGEYSSINQSHAAAILMHSMNTREEAETNIDQLKALEDNVGEKTIELLKRASPTKQELNAVIGEIKSKN